MASTADFEEHVELRCHVKYCVCCRLLECRCCVTEAESRERHRQYLLLRLEWIRLFESAYPVFVGASVSASVRILRIRLPDRTAVDELVYLALYTFFITYIGGKICAYYSFIYCNKTYAGDDWISRLKSYMFHPALQSYYYQVSAETCGFAWNSFITSLMFGSIYPEIGLLKISLYCILIFPLIVLMISASEYIQSKIFVGREYINDYLLEFDSDAFGLTIANVILIILYRSIEIAPYWSFLYSWENVEVGDNPLENEIEVGIEYLTTLVLTIIIAVARLINDVINSQSSTNNPDDISFSSDNTSIKVIKSSAGTSTDAIEFKENSAEAETYLEISKPYIEFRESFNRIFEQHRHSVLDSKDAIDMKDLTNEYKSDLEMSPSFHISSEGVVNPIVTQSSENENKSECGCEAVDESQSKIENNLTRESCQVELTNNKQYYKTESHIQRIIETIKNLLSLALQGYLIGYASTVALLDGVKIVAPDFNTNVNSLILLILIVFIVTYYTPKFNLARDLKIEKVRIRARNAKRERHLWNEELLQRRLQVLKNSPDYYEKDIVLMNSTLLRAELEPYWVKLLKRYGGNCGHHFAKAIYLLDLYYAKRLYRKLLIHRRQLFIDAARLVIGFCWEECVFASYEIASGTEHGEFVYIGFLISVHLLGFGIIFTLFNNYRKQKIVSELESLIKYRPQQTN